MATHSSILAWRIPKTEKPGGLQSGGFAKSWIRLSDFTSLLLHRDCNQQVICLLGSWKLLLVKTKLSIGNSLAVQCLGLCVRFLVWECRFHKPCSMAKHLLKTEKQKQKPTQYCTVLQSAFLNLETYPPVLTEFKVNSSQCQFKIQCASQERIYVYFSSPYSYVQFHIFTQSYFPGYLH